MCNYKNWKKKNQKKRNLQQNRSLCRKQELNLLSLIFKNGKKKKKRSILLESTMKIDFLNSNKIHLNKLKKKKRLYKINKNKWRN